MKICGGCNKEKTLDSFNRRGKGYQPRCRECNSAYGKQWHQDNKAIRLPKLAAQKRARVEAAKEYVVDYLRNQPCVDCGEADIRTLQFDHLRDKVKSISKLVCDGYPITVIQSEINKCEVRCANCHSIKTYVQFGWTHKD